MKGFKPFDFPVTVEVDPYIQIAIRTSAPPNGRNHLLQGGYPRTAMIVVGKYDGRYNRTVFPQYVKRIQMIAVRKHGFVLVDVVTDIVRKKR